MGSSRRVSNVGAVIWGASDQVMNEHLVPKTINLCVVELALSRARRLSENRKSTRQLLRYVGPLHCSTSGTPDRYIHVVVRKSHFGPFLRSFSFMYRMYGMLVLQEQKPVNMSNYTQSTRYAHGAGSTQSVPQTTCHGAGPSPQMIEKMTAKWLSLATTSILGQAPRLLRLFLVKSHFFLTTMACAIFAQL